MRSFFGWLTMAPSHARRKCGATTGALMNTPIDAERGTYQGTSGPAGAGSCPERGTYQGTSEPAGAGSPGEALSTEHRIAVNRLKRPRFGP
jgi:hypothetical protein